MAALLEGLVNVTTLNGTTLNGTNESDELLNASWFNHVEIEHFLGDPDVDHAIALVLGATSVVYGRRLPQLLAAVASVSFGLWVGLVVEDRQAYNNPLFGSVELPEGTWVPIVAGVLAGAAAAVLCKIAWRAALALLTAGIIMLLALSICRLFNVAPDRVVSVGASLLSAYRIVGSIVLILAILGSAFAVKKLHRIMIEFASAFLGTLLLLSGVSHFATKVGGQAPFSLLDDLARIISEVRDKNCHLWDNEESHHLEKCDCQAECQTEICAWTASSVTVLFVRWLKTRLQQRREARLKKEGEEERKPLSQSAEDALAHSPSGGDCEPASASPLRRPFGFLSGASPQSASLPEASPRAASEPTPRSRASPTAGPQPQVVGAEKARD